ncbi:hypothetical protein BLNAU_23103 [Blattamonas nauphoetae]|uniref:Uncharacterized protein n=1 Tax=Blattamonas nauphoetae TaxID=2049346 RepID=A0ABQ9WVC0_9EUKA|nr:hypothetical protein BLNAU_23103 [Blattamonas nauphoetae]
MEGRNQASKTKLRVEGKNGITAETSNSTMFIFSNCTTSLWNVFLDSGGMGTTIGRLRSSSVRIVGSRILSNADNSPFVIDGGESGVGSSICVIDNSDTRHNEHFTTRSDLTTDPTPNYIFTLCTFKNCSVGNGAAVYAYYVAVNIQIDNCSFHACIADYGGVIYLEPPYNGQQTLSLASSSFADCYAYSSGGSLYVKNISSLSISECAFLNSTASRYGGGAMRVMYSSFGGAPGISHTLFQKCAATSTDSAAGGAALQIRLCPSHKLTFVQFRQCHSKLGLGHDIGLYDTPFTPDSYSTCDSTSSPTHRVTDLTTSPETDLSNLLAIPDFEATIESLASTQTGDDTVTLTLTLNKAVSGTMIVMVTNVEESREDVDGEAPTIGRLLLFSFSSSTVGTCSSSCGQSGLLQRPLSDYTLLAASLSNLNVAVPSSAVISVTPILHHALCVLDASRTEVEVTFSGFDIPKGHCTLTLNDSTTLDVTFNDNENGRSVGNITTGVSGKAGELSEKTEYSISGMVSQMSPSASIVIAPGVAFSVETASRLSKVSVSEFLDLKKTKVKLAFESVGLEKNKAYRMEMERTDTSEDKITREVLTDGNGVLVDAIEILYPFVTDPEERKQQLKFDGSYRVLSLTSSDRPRSVLISNFLIPMPDEPSRFVEIVKTDDEGLNSTTLTLSSRALTVGVNYEMKVTGTPLTSSSSTASSNSLHDTSIKFTVSSATVNTLKLTLYPLADAIVKYGHSYSVDWMKVVGGDPIIIETDGCGFETPKEPSRICNCAEAALNKDQSIVTISLEGRALNESLVSIWVSLGGINWESSTIREISETHCKAEFLVASEQSSTHLKYTGEYTLCLNPSEPDTLLVDSGITFRVPAPPCITSLACVFVNSLQNLCKIQVKGTDLRVGTEYEVTLNNTVTFGVRFKTSTEGESEEVSIGKNEKLKHNTRYTLTDVKPTRDDDGEILHSGTLSFTTKEQTAIEVLVREGGGSETQDCGTMKDPCSCVLVGWRGGEEGGVESVIVKIDGSGRFGGRVVVGEKSVEIGGLFAIENELKVESSDLGKDGEEGVVSVSGGRVVIGGVRLSLPSGWEMGEKKVGSVLSGFGECVVREVSIVSRLKGEGVGMGLVCWLGGSLSVEKIVMEGVEMEPGRVLVNCSSSKKDVSFEMAESRFVEVETQNAELVRFSSKSKDSHFEMKDCVFLSTERVESEKVEDGMGVIVVETWQEKTEIRKCVFSESGTVIGRGGEEKKGGVLSIVVGSSNVRERREVGLLGNLFVDSSVSWSESGEERRGGVAVWSVGVGQTKIDLCGSWFEETGVSGVVFDRDRYGVPILERKRKIVPCLSGCGSVGLVVVGGRTVPVICRAGSSFSGCSLRMVSNEAEHLMNPNNTEL